MEDNQRQHISLEGKLSILLGLIGLGGVGALQVLPPPYNDYVGWTLIWGAIIGVVALGIYHVSTTVESPRYVSKPKPTPMTAAEVGFLLSIGAAAVSLIALGLRHRSTAIIAALVACLAVSFDFADRQWFINAAPAQVPLSPDNAKLEVRAWTAGPLIQAPSQITPSETPGAAPTPTPILRQYGANIYTINKGKHDAIGMRHFGIILLSGAELADRAISAFYPFLKGEIAISEPPTKARIEAGTNNVWFSILSGELTDKQFDALSHNAMIPYALSVMQYRDDLIAPDKFIYTESCAYFLLGAIHICPRGDNVTYISD